MMLNWDEINISNTWGFVFRYEGALDPWMSSLWIMLYQINPKFFPNGPDFVISDATLIDRPKFQITYLETDKVDLQSSSATGNSVVWLFIFFLAFTITNWLFLMLLLFGLVSCYIFLWLNGIPLQGPRYALNALFSLLGVYAHFCVISWKILGEDSVNVEKENKHILVNICVRVCCLFSLVIAGYSHFLFKNKTIFSVSINMAVVGYEVVILLCDACVPPC